MFTERSGWGVGKRSFQVEGMAGERKLVLIRGQGDWRQRTWGTAGTGEDGRAQGLLWSWSGSAGI